MPLIRKETSIDIEGLLFVSIYFHVIQYSTYYFIHNLYHENINSTFIYFAQLT